MSGVIETIAHVWMLGVILLLAAAVVIGVVAGVLWVGMTIGWWPHIVVAILITIIAARITWREPRQ